MVADFQNTSFETPRGTEGVLDSNGVAPYGLVDEQTLILLVGGVEQSVVFEEGTRSSITAANTEDYALVAGQTLDVSIDGAPAVTVTFNAPDFDDIANATAAEVAGVLISQLPGTAFATVEAGAVVLGSLTKGSGSLINVTGGTAAAAFAFPAGVAGVDNFVDITNATAAEVAAQINAQLTGVTARDNSNRIRLVTTDEGAEASVAVTGGTAAAAFDFPANAAVGKTNPGTALRWRVTTVASRFEFARFADSLDTPIFAPDLETLYDEPTEEEGTPDGTTYDADSDGREFDGATDRIDYPGLELAGSEFTLAMWINPTLANTGRVFSTRLSAGSGSTFVDVLTDGRVRLFRVGAVSMQLVSALGVLTAGQWHHIAVRSDPNMVAADSQIFVDGVEVASYTTSIDGALPETSTAFGFHLGGRFINDTNNYPGIMTDPRLYDRMLTDAEIGRLAEGFPFIPAFFATAVEDFSGGWPGIPGSEADDLALEMVDNFTTAFFDVDQLVERFLWFGDAFALGATIAATYGTAPQAFEDFTDGWDSEDDVFVQGAVTAAQFDTIAEDVEDFNEDWNGNENDGSALSGLTLMTVGQGGTTETFEPFTEVHTEVEVLAVTTGNVYEIIINGVTCPYVAQGGDIVDTVATELADCINDSAGQVSAVAAGARVQITNEATNTVPFTVGVGGTSPSQIAKIFTGVVQPDAGWTGAEQNACL